MMKLLERKMLTDTMDFAWCTIGGAGSRVNAFAESWELHEGNQERAGFVELWVWRAGQALRRSGEGLELFVNWLGMKRGYEDGEVAGWLVDRNILRYSTAAPVIAEPVIAEPVIAEPVSL
jgi:hypothetical protein